MRTLAFAIVVALLTRPLQVLDGASSAEGALPSREQVQRWRDEAWAAAALAPNLNGWSLAWAELRPSVMSDAEFADLEARVRGRPEHPELPDYEAETQRRRTGKPLEMRYRLFSEGEGRWRVNIDPAPNVHIDSVVTAEGAWRLTGESLRLFDQARLGADGSGEDVRQEVNVFLPQVGRLLHGGFSAGRVSDVVPGPVEVRDGRWRFTAERRVPGSNAPTLAMLYEGDWNADAGRGFVRSARIVANQYKPESVGAFEQFEDWRWDDRLRRWTAARAQVFMPDGRMHREFVLVSVDPLPPGGFDAVTTPPDVSSPDAIRGAVALTEIVDHGRGIATRLGPDGSWTTNRLDGAPNTKTDHRARVAGWLALAGALTGVALWRWRVRASAAERTP